MEEIELLNLRTVCRACALPFPSTVLRDITPPTRDMLAFCTGLEIELMSEMPTRVCGTCLSRADDASQFKIQCLRSEERLRACISALNPVTASTPLGSSTPVDTNAAVVDTISAPNCSIRSEISDIDLPLSPMGCKSEEIFNEGASTAYEAGSPMTKFMNAILAEGHYDSKKKNMIIDEIVEAETAPLSASTPVPESNVSFIKCKNLDSLLPEKHINNSSNETENRTIAGKNIKTLMGENKKELDEWKEELNLPINTNKVEKRTIPGKSFESLVTENEQQISSSQKPRNQQLIRSTHVIRENKRIPHECHVKLIDYLKRAMPEPLVYKSLKELNIVRCRYCFHAFQECKTLYKHLRDQHSLECIGIHGADYVSLAMPEHLLRPELAESNYVRCWFCNSRFRKVRELYLHLKKKHKSQCKTNCDGIDYVRRAMPGKSSSEEFVKLGFVRCRFCYQPHKKLFKLYQHLRKKHFSECKQCKDGYDYIKMAMPVTDMIKSNELLKCQYCRLRFPSVEQLYGHLQNRHDHDCENTWKTSSRCKCYICNECGKTFMKKINLVKHLATHERRKTAALGLYCKKCNRSFKTVPSHKAHMRTHKLKLSKSPPQNAKAKSKRDYICVTCGKYYSTASNLRAHVQTHGPDQRLPCPHCARVFRLPISLSRHLVIHKEKSYKCNECSKVFRRSDNLTRHYRLHTGEKPYKCAECSKRFNQHGLLKMHMQQLHIDFRCRRVVNKGRSKSGKTGTAEVTLQCDETRNIGNIEQTFQNDEIGNVPRVAMTYQNDEL